MASTYTISTGTGRLSLNDVTGTYVALQVTADSALNADITIKLQHTADGVNYFDLPSTEKTLVSGGDSVYIESYDYTLDNLYLYINVGSATLGTLDVLPSLKKKLDSDVNVVSNEADLFKEPNFDAFGRLRVSQVNSQADLKQIHDALPLFYDTEVIGTATVSHNSSTSDTSLNTSANNDKAFIQTKQRYNYSSGKSSLILITFRNFKTNTTNAKRVGYFNTTTTTPFFANIDGLYLQSQSGVITFVIANDGTRTDYDQSTWDDPMDGTGASGIDLELATTQGNLLLWMDWEWLGVGQVRFGFIKDGIFYIAHKIDHIGGTGVYMKSPNHSIRAELRQNTASPDELTLICATYGTEGEVNKLGKILSANMGSTHVDANSTSSTYALIGMRLGANYLDTLVDLLNFTILAITNDNQRWEVWLNPTVAGTFTYGAVANSSIEIAKGSGSGNTVTTTGANLLASGYVTASSADTFDLQSAIRLGSTIAGVADTIVLCTTPLTSNSDVIASLTWREIV